jgi:hypothetical protein
MRFSPSAAVLFAENPYAESRIEIPDNAIASTITAEMIRPKERKSQKVIWLFAEVLVDVKSLELMEYKVNANTNASMTSNQMSIFLFS